MLNKIFTAIRSYGGKVNVDKHSVFFDCDFKTKNFNRIKPLLYYLLNKSRYDYFIVIKGVPYCFLPDCVHYMVYEKKPDTAYLKKDSCTSCKYNTACPGIEESFFLKNYQVIKPVLDLPEEIAIEITQQCNLQCPLCFKQKKQKDMLLDSVKSVIDESVSLGIRDMRFTGGEPFFYKHLEKALIYAKIKNCYVTINTNATIFNEQVQEMCKRYVDNVLVSLQGFNSFSEKKLTQSRFNFSQKIKNIINLRKIIPIVRLGTIVSRTFIENKEKYLKLVKKIGIMHWELYRPMTGKGIDEFKIVRKELLELMRWMQAVKMKTDINIMIFNPVPFCISNDLDLSAYTLFGALKDDGHTRLVRDARGFRPSYSIKKYCGRSIKEAWGHPFLEKMRSLSYLPQKCRECFYLKWCKGGSRYMAYIKNNDFFTPDPLMEVRSQRTPK